MNINESTDPLETDEQPKKQSSYWRWILTIVAIGLFIYQFSHQDFQQTISIIKNMPLLTMLAAIGLTISSRVAIAARWNALLKINAPKPKFKDSLKTTFAGLFSSNVLPTSIGGDFVRLFMGIQAKLDPAYIASSLIMDRIIGFTGMFFFMPFGLNLLFNSSKTPSISFVSMSLMFMVTFSDIFKKVWEWIKKFVQKVLDSIKLWLKHPVYLLESLGFTFLHMALFFSTIWLLLHSMHVDLSIFKIGAIYSLSYVISLFPLSIGGLGIQELAISNLFSTLGNMPLETANALALLLRLAYIVSSIPGVFFLPDIGKKKKQLSTKEN
ncbi:MAG: lysylphosphatidylglycerol synthase transmembrane domain-containing protein [Anaerolineaceae bacterium]